MPMIMSPAVSMLLSPVCHRMCHQQCRRWQCRGWRWQCRGCCHWQCRRHLQSPGVSMLLSPVCVTSSVGDGSVEVAVTGSVGVTCSMRRKSNSWVKTLSQNCNARFECNSNCVTNVHAACSMQHTAAYMDMVTWCHTSTSETDSNKGCRLLK